MTPTTFAAGSATNKDVRVTTLVSAAHFVSHYYILVLPPLFALVRADFGVSYVELGIALSAFNVVSAVMQTPAGFLVDRFSARAMLIGGLAVGAVALVLASLATTFWLFVAAFALLGLGNTVYHPADYTLLSHRVAMARMSHAYSVHTFAGILGSSVAPTSLLYIAERFGWRGAFLGAAALGIAAAILLWSAGGVLAGSDAPIAPAKAEDSDSSLRLLLAPAILMNLLFFVLLSLAGAGVQNYAVVALEALRGTPLTIGNLALSSYLLLSAVGVLIGGFAAGRTTHHDGVAVFGLAASAAATLVIAFVDVPASLLILLMAIAGLFQGLTMPSRDMLVRAVTPAGSFGKVFGFVTSGFNIAGMVAPLVFGWMMDEGNPQAVFVASAAFGFASIATVMATVPRRLRA